MLQALGTRLLDCEGREIGFGGSTLANLDRIDISGMDPRLKACRIEAACDFYLMPSHFEPCGLNQMYSLRYGTIPVVRATGGLDDSVIDFTRDEMRANGIKFQEYSARALAKAMRKALAIYSLPDLLRRYRQNAMTADFSWDRTVGEYLKAYTPVNRAARISDSVSSKSSSVSPGKPTMMSVDTVRSWRATRRDATMARNSFRV